MQVSRSGTAGVRSTRRTRDVRVLAFKDRASSRGSNPRRGARADVKTVAYKEKIVKKSDTMDIWLMQRMIAKTNCGDIDRGF